MSEPPSKSKLKHSIIGVVVGCIASIIFAVTGLFTDSAIPYVTLAATIICSVLGWKEFERVRRIFVIILCMIALGALIYIMYRMNAKDVPDPNETAPISDVDSTTSPVPTPTSAPSPSLPPPNSMETLENDGTLMTVEQIETDTIKDGAKYLPIIAIADYRHLFISITEEFDDTISEQEYIDYALDHFDDYNDTGLKNLIYKKYIDTYKTVEDFSALEANKDPIVSELVIAAQDLNTKITQAYANNESVLDFYNELSKCYLEIIERAPRGEFYLQLGRPYEEQILHMRRVTNEEKNSVLKNGAEAIVAFRTSLTYIGETGETSADLFYRIAKIYHYLGDTPELDITVRSYLYRVSAAYMELASEMESAEDDYYGYISYYKAMVYHKLAIVSTDSGMKRTYFELAKASYRKADNQREFESSIEKEIEHAIEDIDYRYKKLS